MHLNTREVTIDQHELDEFLLSALLRRVFHVTNLKNLGPIKEAKEIDPLGPGERTFGHAKNGFFRNRNCVSVFDLRDPEHVEFERSLSKCHPLQPLRVDAGGIAIFVLEPYVYARLLSWRLWKTEEAHRQMIVPYIEAGYPGPLLLESISEIIVLKSPPRRGGDIWEGRRFGRSA